MKILISIDTGRSAETVLHAAKDFLIGFPEAEVHVFTVLDMAIVASERDFEGPIVMDTMERQAHDLTATATAILGDRSFIITHEIGSPVEEILEKAEKIRCDILIIGSRSHSGLDNILIGSVAEKVMREVKCPTLIIPIRMRREEV